MSVVPDSVLELARELRPSGQYMLAPRARPLTGLPPAGKAYQLSPDKSKWALVDIGIARGR